MPFQVTILRKGLILVAVPLVFQLALIGLVALTQRHTDEAQRTFGHTKEVRAQSETILARLADLQAGSRGLAFSYQPEQGERSRLPFWPVSKSSSSVGELIADG